MEDILILNARILDDNGAEKYAWITVKAGQISCVSEHGRPPEALKSIDAQGRWLFPGFIDFHTHLFVHGSSFGMDADRLLKTGVILAADMGSAGWGNYPAFHKCDVEGKRIHIKSYLNVSQIGQPGHGMNEPLDERAINEERIQDIAEAYPEEIAGLKIRISREITGALGLEPLRRTIDIGRHLSLPVCVHTTDPPVCAGEIASLLRPGDIYSHAYHGQGYTVLSPDDGVCAEVLDAQHRGVLIEVGNGKRNFDFNVANLATAGGLWPNIISSDCTAATFHKEPSMWDLPMVMSKFLALGMPLADVIKAVTLTPAKKLGVASHLGSIRTGYEAAMVLCRLEEGSFPFCDSAGNRREGKWKIIPDLIFFQNQIIKSNEKA